MFMQAATKNLYMAIDDNPVKLIDRLGQDTSPAPDIGQSIPIRVEDRSAHLLSRADWGNFSDIAPGTGRVMGALLKQYNPKALLPALPRPGELLFSGADAKPEPPGATIRDPTREDFDYFLSLQGPGSPQQNLQLQRDLQIPVLVAALPEIAAALGTTAVISGVQSLSEGNYDLAVDQFMLGLSLLPGAQEASQAREVRDAYRSLYAGSLPVSPSRVGTALQDELIQAATRGNDALRGDITVSVGVGVNAAGEPVTLVSTNAGAPRDLVERVRGQLGDRGVFVEGTGHAEVNVIEAGNNLSDLRVGASNYHCPECQVRAEGQGVTLIDPNKGFRLNPKAKLIAATSADPSAADYLNRHPFFPSILY